MTYGDPITQTKAILSGDGELVGSCSKEGAIRDLDGKLLAWVRPKTADGNRSANVTEDHALWSAGGSVVVGRVRDGVIFAFTSERYEIDPVAYIPFAVDLAYAHARALPLPEENTHDLPPDDLHITGYPDWNDPAGQEVWPVNGREFIENGFTERLRCQAEV